MCWRRWAAPHVCSWSAVPPHPQCSSPRARAASSRTSPATRTPRAQPACAARPSPRVRPKCSVRASFPRMICASRPVSTFRISMNRESKRSTYGGCQATTFNVNLHRPGRKSQASAPLQCRLSSPAFNLDSEIFPVSLVSSRSLCLSYALSILFS